MIQIGNQKYEVRVGSPEGQFQSDIFNSYTYFQIHQDQRDVYLSLVRVSDGKIFGVSHFGEMNGGIFQSPRRATYGGWQVLENDYFLLETFVDQTLSILRTKGCKEIIVKPAPFNHEAHSSHMLFNILHSKGFRVIESDLNYCIQIDQRPFPELVARNNRKRYKKCAAAGFHFKQETTSERKREVYEVLSKNRSSKGYIFSMNWTEVEQMERFFASDVFYFSVSDEESIVAGAFCLKVNPNVLYVLFWGDLPGYGDYSPVVFLANGLYEFAKSSGFKILDLGTAAKEDGTADQGLMKFKQRLGATEGVKLTYSCKPELIP